MHGGTKAAVTVANGYAYAVTLLLSQRQFLLAPGRQHDPFEHIIDPHGSGSVEIRSSPSGRTPFAGPVFG